MDNAAILGKDQILDLYTRIVGEQGAAKYDRTRGWLRQYHGKLADRRAGERYLRSILNTVRLKPEQLAGKRVLDVGCGFGLTMSSLVWLGADSAHGIDMYRQMVDTVEAYKRDVPRGDRIEVTVGRANAMPYPDDYFDIALTTEALSHFIDPLGCIRETLRVLKPGGMYVITDDNNGANPAVVRENQEVWDRFELGPPTDDIHGHRVKVPYVEKRRRIIAARFPDLEPPVVDRLAQDTAFMDKSAIIEAVERFRAAGVMPGSPYVPGRCPVEPEDGQYIENLIDPLALRKDMEAMGFDVHLEAYFGGASRGGILKAVNGLINRTVPTALALRVSPGFRIWARKRGG